MDGDEGGGPAAGTDAASDRRAAEREQFESIADNDPRSSAPHVRSENHLTVQSITDSASARS